jgi:hypothetical protein
MSNGSLPDVALDLAAPVEVARACVHLARLQLHYALGVFLDRLELTKKMKISALPLLHNSFPTSAFLNL